MKHRVYDDDGRRVSVRMCAACRSFLPKGELVRIVRQSGAAAVDNIGNMPGRGAYLCKNGDCIRKGQKIRALERALHVSDMGKLYEELLRGCINGEG